MNIRTVPKTAIYCFSSSDNCTYCTSLWLKASAECPDVKFQCNVILSVGSTRDLQRQTGEPSGLTTNRAGMQTQGTHFCQQLECMMWPQLPVCVPTTSSGDMKSELDGAALPARDQQLSNTQSMAVGVHMAHGEWVNLAIVSAWQFAL